MNIFDYRIDFIVCVNGDGILVVRREYSSAFNKSNDENEIVGVGDDAKWLVKGEL